MIAGINCAPSRNKRSSSERCFLKNGAERAQAFNSLEQRPGFVKCWASPVFRDKTGCSFLMAAAAMDALGLGFAI